MSNDRYVYQVVEIKPGIWGLKSQRISDELNRLGAQGWELVTALQPNGVSSLRLFLKKLQ